MLTLRNSVIALLVFGALIGAVSAQPMPPSPSPKPVAGVKGTVYRPFIVETKAKSGRISSPGEYQVKVGDVIELEYQYTPLAQVPKADVKKVETKVSKGGAVAASDLGVRFIDDYQITTRKIVCFFIAKKEGKDTVTLVIDGNSYEYKIDVMRGDEKK